MAAKCSSDGTNAFDKAKERRLVCSICIFCTESPNAEEVFNAKDVKRWGYFPAFSLHMDVFTPYLQMSA